MSLRDELWNLKDAENIDIVADTVPTCGTIAINGKYESYEHLTAGGDGDTEAEVGPVIAGLPKAIRKALVGSYGEGSNGLSHRELNLIEAGVQMAVLALHDYVTATEPADDTPSDV